MQLNPAEEIVRCLGALRPENTPLQVRLLNAKGFNMGASTPLPEGMTRGPMKNCYQNSQQRITGDLFYCEGYACSRALGIPVEHAWLLDLNGNVIDPTWEGGDFYFGVPFDMHFVMDCTMTTGYYGIFGSLYMLPTKSGMSHSEIYDYLESGVALEVTARAQ